RDERHRPRPAKRGAAHLDEANVVARLVEAAEVVDGLAVIDELAVGTHAEPEDRFRRRKSRLGRQGEGGSGEEYGGEEEAVGARHGGPGGSTSNPKVHIRAAVGKPI